MTDIPSLRKMQKELGQLPSSTIPIPPQQKSPDELKELLIKFRQFYRVKFSRVESMEMEKKKFDFEIEFNSKDFIYTGITMKHILTYNNKDYLAYSQKKLEKNLQEKKDLIM